MWSGTAYGQGAADDVEQQMADRNAPRFDGGTDAPEQAGHAGADVCADDDGIDALNVGDCSGGHHRKAHADHGAAALDDAGDYRIKSTRGRRIDYDSEANCSS